MTETKRCRRCGNLRDLTLFAPHPHRPAVRVQVCRICRGKRISERRSAPEQAQPTRFTNLHRTATVDDDEYRAGIRGRFQRVRREAG